MRKSNRYLGLCLFVVMGVSLAPAAESGTANLEETSQGRSNGLLMEQPAGMDAAELKKIYDNPPRLPSLPQKKSLSWPPGSDKIDERILDLLNASHKKSLGEMQHEATAKGLLLADNDLLAVNLSAHSARELQQLRKQVLDANGKVVASFENTLYAYLPLAAIEQMGQEKSLSRLEPQALFQPLYMPPSFAKDNIDWHSGLKLTGADTLHSKGVRGQGVKVGILDMEFAGYEKLQEDKVLPAPAAYKLFSASGKPAKGVHGSACAEIVHTMAPDAALYLAEFDGSTGQLFAAVTWLVEQGVDIISYSAGSHYGPHDGTSEHDKFINDLVTKNDILWVAAAGNEGESHFSTMIEDQDGDELVDIRPANSSDKILPLMAIKANGMFRILANWDDWPKGPEEEARGIDLDLYLYTKKENGKDAGLELVSSSEIRQGGRAKPIEALLGTGKKEGQAFYLAIKLDSKVEPSARLHVYLDGAARMSPVESYGSVGIPATAKVVVAVGAVDVTTGKLEKYSSQGKTDDGRMKPEISAPDKVPSQAYQATGLSDVFPGTSAACPHLAGAAALLKEAFPEAGQAELRKVLLEHAKATGESSPNPQYGYGIVQLADIKLTTGQDNAMPPASQDHPAASPSVEDVMHELFPAK